MNGHEYSKLVKDTANKMIVHSDQSDAVYHAAIAISIVYDFDIKYVIEDIEAVLGKLK